MMEKDSGALSGSRPSDRAPAGLDASRVDPARGPMRIIYSDAPGIEALAQRRLLGGGVCAVVGPFGKHTSQPELQDALALVMMAFNRRHGHLSPEKYRELLGGRDYGEAVKLLREALPQPRATPSKLDPILEEMREAFLAQGVPGEEIPF